MAQLSRPYQFALIAVAVLALAWFTLLRAHASTSPASSSSGPSISAKAAKIGEAEQHEGTPTPVYHGPVPGLSGLSKDIRRAHEAVGASEAQAHREEGTPAQHAQAASSVAAAPAAKFSHPAAPARAARPAATARHASAATRAGAIEAQLNAGKIVLLLFWNPRSSDDQAVHSQVQTVSRSLKGKVAPDFAKAREVGSFGTVTRDVSVLQTPTLLIIDRKGLTTTITGLTDAFSIEQAVREAGG